MASCCRDARFSRASSRCDFRFDRAVANRGYSRSIIGVGELDPERGNVNDCAVNEVLRRHNLQGVLPLFKGAGGKLVKRLKVDTVIHGRSSGMVLVMDFDSADAISGMFESEDYAALVPVRNRGFTEMNILLTREM